MNAALRAPKRGRPWPDGAGVVAERPSPGGRIFHFGFAVADLLGAACRQRARHGAGLPG